MAASAPIETVSSSSSSSNSSSSSFVPAPPPPPPPYRLAGMKHSPEDILFCIDTDRQIDADMKASGARGQCISRLDAIKQSIFLFVSSKLSMNPRHRFAFSSLSTTASLSLQQNFTSDMEVISNTVRNLTSSGNFPECDLSSLFHLAALEARKSQAQGRVFRVILIYCRSEVVPTFPDEWPTGQYPFVLDSLYLHDKPTDMNCPQRVFDTLVEASGNMGEGHIYENGSGLTRILFRQICCLLVHPEQRCVQDDFKVPKDISKATITLDGSTNQSPIIKNPEEFGLVS